MLIVFCMSKIDNKILEQKLFSTDTEAALKTQFSSVHSMLQDLAVKVFLDGAIKCAPSERGRERRQSQNRVGWVGGTAVERAWA